MLVNSVGNPKLRFSLLEDILVRLGSLEIPVRMRHVTEFAL